MSHPVESLTQARLKEILHYDPETGLWVWLVDANRRWAKAGSIAGKLCKGAIIITFKGRGYFAHRLAFLYMTGKWPKDEVDHRDLDASNNRWKNLREATHAQNMRNVRLKSNVTGFKGVYVYKHKGGKKFFSQIMFEGVVHWLGIYDTSGEASLAYTKAAQELHGDFARAV